jgi:hypothetical protein
MPTYAFRNKQTQEVFEKFMSISAREQYLAENPDIETVVSAPAIGDMTNNKKPDAGFRDVLKEIRRKHDARFTRSTINTF